MSFFTWRNVKAYRVRFELDIKYRNGAVEKHEVEVTE